MSDRFPGFTPVKDVKRPCPRTLSRWHKAGKIELFEFCRQLFVRDEDLVPRPLPKPQRHRGGRHVQK